MESKPCTPAHFGTLLARLWAEGITKVRHLLAEIRNRGYTGSFSHLARFLAPWRRRRPSPDAAEEEDLDSWLVDARASGIYAMQRFAKTIRQDLEAVRNAVLEPWSNGQTEGQINKLKTLKRAMYGRAGLELLRAQMMPL
jgi:hypothetical protein